MRQPPGQKNLTGDHVREVPTPHSRDLPGCASIMLDYAEMSKRRSNVGDALADITSAPVSMRRCYNTVRPNRSLVYLLPPTPRCWSAWHTW
jgi:hypothetical protein